MIDRRRATIVLFAGALVLRLAAFSLADAPAEVDPAAKKAVGDAIQGVIGRLKAAAEQQPREMGNKAERSLDERALVNREHRQQWERAKRMLRDGQASEALPLLQHLLNAEEDSLLPAGRGRWTSLHAAVEEAILQATPEVRQTYQRMYGRTAEARLQQARQTGVLAALADVTRRYFATSAGEAAADQIAMLMQDAGHPVEAAHWYRRLLAANAGLTRSNSWQRRAARAFAAAGLSPANLGDVNASAGPSSLEVSSFTNRFPLTEWLQPFGGPTHRGTAPDFRPVLIESWSHPLTQRPENQRQIEGLVRDLRDNGRACLPAAIPLAVDGRIIFRTLRGVTAVDAVTGRTIWETPEELSVERLLAGEPAARLSSEAGVSRLRPVPSYDGQRGEQSALASVLFQDSVYGLISSDGERVFVLEDHAVLSYHPPGSYRGQPMNDDPHGRDWTTNRLVAYDVQSGRRLWSVGGSHGEGPFSRVLTDTLFQGPPVVDGDELFIIGERRGAEYLFALDRRTGAHLWSHMLASAAVEIQHDLVRRWWPAQPAVGAGVVICPTTVGWIVAIDRLEHRIRWARQLTRPGGEAQLGHQNAVAFAGPLNARWSLPAPVLVDGVVVYTPPELPDPEHHTAPYVLALNAVTGDVLWRQEKGAALALAGVWNRSVLLIAEDQFQARDLATGNVQWIVHLDEDSGRPSGRGVVAGETYLLPLESGELWSVRLRDGEIEGKARGSTGLSPLGNLVIYQGRLTSYAPHGVTSFENLEKVESISVAALQTLTPSERLETAELAVIQGDHAKAVSLLKELDWQEHDSGIGARARTLYQQSLITLIGEDLSRAGDHLAALRSVAVGNNDVVLVEDLQAQRELALGHGTAAFDRYWKLAALAEPLQISEGQISVRLDRWLSARLEGVYSSLTPGEKKQIDQQLGHKMDEFLSRAPETLEWWSQVLSFHQQGRSLSELLAQQCMQQGRLAEAEMRLVQLLIRPGDANRRPEYLRDLHTLLTPQGRELDAAAYSAQFASRPFPESQEGQEDAGESDHRLESPREPEPFVPPADWSSDSYSLSRTGGLFSRQASDVPLSLVNTLPSLDGIRVSIRPALQRFCVQTSNGGRLWDCPLRWEGPFPSSQNATAAAVGQLIFVLHRSVLHAFSLPDQELRWSLPLDAGVASRVTSAPGQSFEASPELQTAPEFLNTSGLQRRGASEGALAIYRADYLCYLGRDSVTLADPLTGRTWWTRNGVRPGTIVHGNRGVIVLVSNEPQAAHARAMRVMDGHEIELPHLQDALASVVGLTETGFLVFDTLAPQQQELAEHVDLVHRDLVSGEATWRLAFPRGTRFGAIAQHTLIALQPDGRVRLVDWATGSDRVLGNVDRDLVRSVVKCHAIADRWQVYLSFCQSDDRELRLDSSSSFPINGQLVALDRHGRGMRWQRAVEHQALMMDQWERLPVLLLVSRRTTSPQPDVRMQQMHVEVLDKWTGQPLLNERRYVSGGVRGVEFDLPRRTIDVKTYRERLRIEPETQEERLPQ